MHIKNKCLKQILIYLLSYFAFSSITFADHNELIDLSVEDLLNIKVTSTSKRAKSLNDSPTAIFVITQEDIKRIGATSVPEALRLAPGIDVARIDASKWAISARGFNGRFANKLLVLIDGRNTYTRAFAGVYWENQDIMLEDVERIEVIRGPGATLWGANAVNGVINIITKHSADTLGGLLVAGAGTEEQGFGALRYGGNINKNTTARAYIKGFKRDESTFKSGGEAGDDWDKVQGGFRMDSQFTPKDTLTIQGDAYHSNINQTTKLARLTPPYQDIFNETIDTFGGNLLIRQQHNFSATSDYALQFIYDYYQRNEFFSQEYREVIDIDFQHSFSLLNWNNIIWGAKYRYTHDDVHINNTISLNNVNQTNRNDQLFSAFIQNEITLLDNQLWLTLGSKFEHNDFSGFEIQPTARLMWIPHTQHRLWGAISRSVRTPSRLEHDVDILGTVTPDTVDIAAIFQGDQQFESEKIVSYELGYRTTFINDVSIDLTAFYNDYSNLKSVTQGTPFFNPKTNIIELPYTYSNNFSAQTYGFELAAIWQMLDWWRWDTNYSLLKTEVEGVIANELISKGPQQQISLRSAMSPWHTIDFDILLRYVDSTRTIGFMGPSIINDYISMDIRLAWHPTDAIELSLVGQNLLASHHQEYHQETYTQPTEIDRGMYGKLVWHF